MSLGRTIRIDVIEGPDVPLSITSDRDRISIGRDRSSDLLLGDAMISRRHAEIVQEGDALVLVDLDSANGTFLASDRRSRISRSRLEDGALLLIGRNVLKVTVIRTAGTTVMMARTDLAPNDATAIAVNDAPRIELTVKGGPDQGAVFATDKPQIRIGRHPSCDVHLNDPEVSRVHATIQRDSGGFTIFDEHSANGVHIGNSQVFFSRLVDGVVVRLGETQLEVRLTGSMMPSSAPESARAIAASGSRGVTPRRT